LRRAHLLDGALIEDRDPVGQIKGLFLIVGDEDSGYAGGIMDAPQLLAQARLEQGAWKL